MKQNNVIDASNRFNRGLCEAEESITFTYNDECVSLTQNDINNINSVYAEFEVAKDQVKFWRYTSVVLIVGHALSLAILFMTGIS